MPPLELSGERQGLLERATLALGRLDSIALLLPDPQLFLYAYVRREAVLSSQIEGTQSSLSDLLLFELDEQPGVPFGDVVEVSNYVAALEHGMARLREGFPLCNRLLREMHGRLMERGRGSEKLPGEFRRSQNWIGGTRPGRHAAGAGGGRPQCGQCAAGARCAAASAHVQLAADRGEHRNHVSNGKQGSAGAGGDGDCAGVDGAEEESGVCV